MERSTNGIYLLCNDFAVEWLIAAVESLRAKGCTLPICIVPFDENIQQLKRFAQKYQLLILEDDSFPRLEQFGSEFTTPLKYIRMFRKFAIFWGPFENFIYADVDIVALMNWDEIMQTYISHPPGLWYLSRSPQEVYHPGPFWDEMRQKGRAPCFNAGLYISSRGVLDWSTLEKYAGGARKVKAQFLDIADQAFLNYCFDVGEIPAESISKFMPNVFDWNWSDSEYRGRSDMFEIADREGQFEGKQFPCVHWAGHSLWSAIPHRDLFLKYRLLNAPPSDHLYYNLTWHVRPIFGNALRGMYAWVGERVNDAPTL
jgi:hypothetical protein